MTMANQSRSKGNGAAVLSKRIAVGLVGLGVLGTAFGAWSLSAELAGAVIAPGRVTVDGHTKRVQATSGGAVAQMAVREGDVVRANDLLLRLEDTQQRVTLKLIESQLVEAEALRHRLLAERDDLPAINWSPTFSTSHAQASEIGAEEERLFKMRLDLHRGQQKRLDAKRRQTQREIASIEEQTRARARERELAQEERGVVLGLADRRLSNLPRRIGVERDTARAEAELSHMGVQLARAEAVLAEIDLQRLALDQSRLADAQKELRAVKARIDELTERRLAARQSLASTELRAPVDGVVHDLQVHGKGAVLKPGETILSIVPGRNDLVAELRIRPEDIDQVQPGQLARLKFTAFHQRTTPELEGRLVRVAPDLVKDSDTKMQQYTATVRVDEVEVAKLGALKLVVGMPAEGHIRTSERTLASFLLRPLSDQLSRALRED